MFSWSYQDLKVYDTNIVQHTIPVKEDDKPFKQKLRRLIPLLMTLIEKEIKKLFDANIIISMMFPKMVG